MEDAGDNQSSCQTPQNEISSDSKQPVKRPIHPRKPSKSEPARKVSKHTALVWDHFKMIDEDIEEPKVACDYCNTTYTFTSENDHVLDHMHAHLSHQCPKYPYRFNKRKRLMCLELQREDVGEAGSSNIDIPPNDRCFNIEELRCTLAKMIIVDGLPFSIVEGEGFKSYSRALAPKFIVPSRFDVARDCMRICEEEKAKLKDVLKSQRVCLTIDTWSSVQNLKYMCLVAHWIDSEWKVNKRILNFRVVPNHKGETIGRVVETCLFNWGIDHIFTVTVDNANSDDGAIRYLRTRTKHWNSTIFGHEFMHVRCGTKILNLTVKECLDDFQESIDKIRHAVRYVRSSHSRLQAFKRCRWFARILDKNLPYVDIEARWDSTYKMLKMAEKFESSFERLGEDDENYVLHFEGDNNDNGHSGVGIEGGKGKGKRKNTGIPDENDWKNVRNFAKFLKHFLNAVLQLSGCLSVTSTSFFHEFMKLQGGLLKLSISGDGILNSMALHLKTKLEKYLGNPDNLNPMLFVAVALDPCCKLKHVKYCFEQVYGSLRADEMTQRVEETLTRMYDHYRKCDSSSNVRLEANSSNETSDEDDSKSLMSFRRYLKQERDRIAKSDVLRYLSEDCQTRDDDFDVLQWWKVNSPKYPVLSQEARDVLAIPISTVSLESAFNMDDHILDTFRSSLPPLILESLICGQNWLKPASTPIDLREAMDELEKYEEVELEFFGSSSALSTELSFFYD